MMNEVPPVSGAAVAVRSLVFQATVLLSIVIIGPWTLLVFLHKPLGRWVVTQMLRTILALLRLICGLTYEVRGLDRLSGGPVLLASNHQSACDAVLLSTTKQPSVVIMKSELLRAPFVGWILVRLGHIPVDRQGDTKTLARFVEQSKKSVADGDTIIIFPEGTRLAPEKSTVYKAGVAVLYKELNVPCVPVALNSGHFWPAQNWRRYPGKITIEFLETMPPGLAQDRFLKELRQRIDAGAEMLVPERPIHDHAETV